GGRPAALLVCVVGRRTPHRSQRELAMQIDRVTLLHVSIPYVSPFQTSRWTETDHECLLVQVKAGGLTGWGEGSGRPNAAYSYETHKTNWHILEDFLVPAVLPLELTDIAAYRAAVEPVMGHN